MLNVSLRIQKIIMKWFVALFAVVMLVAKVSAWTDAELVQRSVCTDDYECKDGCRCETPRRTVPKMCFCYFPHNPNGDLVCRRSEYL